MTDLPVFRRDELFKAFNGDVALVSAFEQLVQYVSEAAGKALQGSTAASVIGNASILVLTADEALSGARVFLAERGIEAEDDGATLKIRLDDLTPKIDGGFPATFIVTGETDLILPLFGTVATLADISGAVAGSVTSFNTRTGAVTLTSGDVTTALGYTPTSVTGLPGVQSVAAFKIGLSLVKGDVGLSNVDNTADASKPVSTAQQTALDLKLNISAYTAADVLAKLLTVDGSGSGVDADLLDAQSGAHYLARANHTGTQAWSTLTGTPTTLAGYGIADAQALHANLTAFSGLSLVADRLPYANGAGTLALATFTAAGRALVDDADAAAQRATLGLVAAGAGDIWVEKAGDTMSGNLLPAATNTYFLGSDALSWRGKFTEFSLTASGVVKVAAIATSAGLWAFADAYRLSNLAGTTDIAIFDSTGLDVIGLSRCDSLRIDQTPAGGTPTPTHTFTINLNGTTYRVPCVV